jgi:SAM-dependent methyltransferase
MNSTKSDTMVFKDYAKYYNLLYSDKDYKKETDYIDSLIRRYLPENNNLVLDAGCGTGKHAIRLAERGYHVTGIDRSEEMIGIADENRNDNSDFHVMDITHFELDTKFDVIISLFHVASYQTSNKDISDMFSNFSKHMRSGGIVIFDFWYTPAVFEQKASVKIKRLHNNEISLVRISEPVHHYNENTIDVNFELHINDISNKNYVILNEQHKMRYFSIPEIDFILDKFGFKSIGYEEWLSGNPPSQNTWGVCCTAIKL